MQVNFLCKPQTSDVFGSSLKSLVSRIGARIEKMEVGWEVGKRRPSGYGIKGSKSMYK